MKNIFLTGERHTGKSTLMERALASFPELCVGGFRTVALRGDLPGALGGVYLLPARARDTECSARNRVGIRKISAPPEAFSAVFDALGDKLLDPAGCSLLLMDELGFLERDAHAFQAAVFRALDGALPVLGTLKPCAEPFLDAIRARTDVLLLGVTEANRDARLDELREALLSITAERSRAK